MALVVPTYVSRLISSRKRNGGSLKARLNRGGTSRRHLLETEILIRNNAAASVRGTATPRDVTRWDVVQKTNSID